MGWHRQPPRGRLAAVIIAVAPVGIGDDRLPAYFVERDLLRAVPRSGGDRHRRHHRVGIRYRPLQSLHPAHGAARKAEQPRNAQMIDQHLLQPHHVANGDYRKRHGIRTTRGGVDGRGSRRAAATAQHIRTDDEILVGVERLARPDHVVPPARLAGFRTDAGGMRIAGKRVQDQDGIALLRVQRAIRLVGHLHRRQRGAAIQGNGVEPDDMGLNNHGGELS